MNLRTSSAALGVIVRSNPVVGACCSTPLILACSSQNSVES
jgi:hypothetical protein